jgi:3-oxosteroid 1-dehydrogenase
MGEVWIPGNHHALQLGIEDSPHAGFRYLKRLSMGYGSDAAILNLVVHAPPALQFFEERIGLQMQLIRGCPDYYYGHCEGSVAEGRMLEVVPFPAQTLGEWQSKTRLSPQMPYGMTHHDMFAAGGVANMAKWDFNIMSERLMRDERCLGPGLAAYFVKGALDRKITLQTGAEAKELLTDGSRVIGVRVSQGGKEVFVKAKRGVVVAVSSYERNQDYNRTVGQQLDLGSMVFSSVDGANFRLTGPLGARVARVPDITSLGFVIPGQPHTIVVNRQGKRFGNEAFYRQFYYTIDQIDGAGQTHPNFPCWVIIDSQVREKYPFASILPGQDWPAGLGATANTIAELAQKIGVEIGGLEQTVKSFNADAQNGADPQFGRGTHPWSAWMCGDPFQKPNPTLGPLVKPPFYAVQLQRLGGSAIASAGVLADQYCRALSWDDTPIEGLYVAGNSQARMETGAVMQSGISNARGMTHGYLAALHALGKPSDLLQREAARLGL